MLSVATIRERTAAGSAGRVRFLPETAGEAGIGLTGGQER
jgi:hypothetical protein